MMTEFRLLTDKEKLTRFDFIWVIEGHPWPLLIQQEAELALRCAIVGAFSIHGVLREP